MATTKYENYIMDDGTEVKLGINMAQLCALRNKDKELYDHVCKYLGSGTSDVADIARFNYGAYCCANPHTDMTFDEFIKNMNQDIEVNATVMLRMKGVSIKEKK